MTADERAPEVAGAEGPAGTSRVATIALRLGVWGVAWSGWVVVVLLCVALPLNEPATGKVRHSCLAALRWQRSSGGAPGDPSGGGAVVPGGGFLGVAPAAAPDTPEARAQRLRDARRTCSRCWNDWLVDDVLLPGGALALFLLIVMIPWLRRRNSR